MSLIVLFRKLFRNLKYLSAVNLERNKIAEFNFEAHLGPKLYLRELHLSDNSITKISGSFEYPEMTLVDLNRNNLSRFFVERFWNKSQMNLVVTLEGNDLESVDFRDINVSDDEQISGKLNIYLSREMRCNCHTISLYNFLRGLLEISKSVYDAIEVSPMDVECRRGFGGPGAVARIDEKVLTCPLDLPHQVLCPYLCSCNRLASESVLKISCSNIEKVPVLPPYKMLNDIKINKVELYISRNGIERLPSKLQDRNYNDVTVINASFNRIQRITVENIPDRLMHLDLMFNRLKYISAPVIARMSHLGFVHLSSNPWNCSSSTEIVKFVKDNRDIVKDFAITLCSDGRYFLEVSTDNHCNGYILLAIFGFLIISCIAALVVAYHIKKAAIAEWIFLHDKRNLIERLKNNFKIFDATIVVADNDQVVGKYIRTKLMNPPNQFKVDLIAKNWSGEDDMPSSVRENLRRSRRTIVILSEYFDEADWTKWNFFNIGNRVIFVIMSRKNTADIEISNKFLIKFRDPWFWDKLKHLMTNQSEMLVEEHDENEMQPLRDFSSN
jgi:Leucine-rich repeat (LRR) protein